MDNQARETINMTKNRGRKILVIYCSTLVVVIIGALSFYYVWSATFIYRQLESKWGAILKACDK